MNEVLGSGTILQFLILRGGRVSQRFAGVAFWFAFEQGWSEAWSVIRHECKAR
jgi:hypothetical protein